MFGNHTVKRPRVIESTFICHFEKTNLDAVMSILKQSFILGCSQVLVLLTQ